MRLDYLCKSAQGWVACIRLGGLYEAGFPVQDLGDGFECLQVQ